MTEHGGIATNIYHINPKYLIETQTVADKRDSEQKPQCSACVNSCSNVRRLSHDLTRLHDVLVDVVADILVAAEQKEIMK